MKLGVRLLGALMACAMIGWIPQTAFAATQTMSKKSIPSHAARQQALDSSILHTAFSFRGLHYDWGGMSPKTGFDCSGFIQYIFDRHGIQLPRTASAQASVGQTVTLNQLKPGDLMFYTDTYANQLANHVTHVALYIGHGNVIESSSVRNQGVVVIHDILDNPWYKARYYGARNVTE